jgi:hypothetical protein
VSIHDYLIDHAAFDWPRLLSAWAWLLPPRVRPWLMNRYGDLFLIYPDGTVHWLDVGRGAVEQVAASRDEFSTKLDEGDNANQWLMIPLVDRAVAAGVRLGPGQCYGFKRPPVLGGDYTVENTAVLPVAEWLGFSGELHEQLREVADGDHVRLVVRAARTPNQIACRRVALRDGHTRRTRAAPDRVKCRTRISCCSSRGR